MFLAALDIWVILNVTGLRVRLRGGGGELGFQRFIRFLEYLYLFLVKCLKVFEWFFSFLDNSDESGKLRKSKEHNDIYWFPSQSESTPVPFQHERDFTIVRSLYKPTQDSSYNLLTKPPRTILLDFSLTCFQQSWTTRSQPPRTILLDLLS